MTSKTSSKKQLTILCFGFIILCAIALLMTACKNTTTDVMSSYDSRFPVKDDGHGKGFEPDIGEVGFDETLMLDDEYFKNSDGTLQLRGPRNAAAYIWTLYLQTYVTNNGVTEPEYTLVTLPDNCFLNDTSEATEYFIVYIPLSGLKPGSYVISLDARSKGGEWYSDRAALIVYDVIREL